VSQQIQRRKTHDQTAGLPGKDDSPDCATGTAENQNFLYDPYVTIRPSHLANIANVQRRRGFFPSYKKLELRLLRKVIQTY
jgi:hypothetical protein